MIIPYQTIKDLCNKDKDKSLIVDPHENSFRTASYDLRLGNEYFMPSTAKELTTGEDWSKCFHQLNNDIQKCLWVPPNGFIIVISLERVNIPTNLVGHLSLKVNLLMKGLIMSSQSQLDAGYSGKIVALFYNLSNEKVQLEYKDPILRLEFARLESHSQKAYKGNYQGTDKLSDFVGGQLNSSSLTVMDEKIDHLDGYIKSLQFWGAFAGLGIVALTHIFSYFGPIDSKVKVLDSNLEKLMSDSITRNEFQLKLQEIQEDNNKLKDEINQLKKELEEAKLGNN